MKVHIIGLRPERRMDTNPGYIELLLEKGEVPYIEEYLGLKTPSSQGVIARRIEDNAGNIYIRIEHI